MPTDCLIVTESVLLAPTSRRSNLTRASFPSASSACHPPSFTSVFLNKKQVDRSHSFYNKKKVVCKYDASTLFLQYYDHLADTFIHRNLYFFPTHTSKTQRDGTNSPICNDYPAVLAALQLFIRYDQQLCSSLCRSVGWLVGRSTTTDLSDRRGGHHRPYQDRGVVMRVHGTVYINVAVNCVVLCVLV